MARQGAPADNAEPASAGQDHPSQETATEAGHGLAGSFMERVIDIRGMDPGLRALTLIGLLTILGCAVLMAVRDLPFATTPVFSFTLRKFETMSLPVLLGCAAVSLLAWCYIVVGALHGHLALRVLGMAAYTLAMAFAIVVSGFVWGLLATFAVLLAAWTLAIGLWLVDRLYHEREAPQRHHRHHLKLPVFLFFAAVTTVTITVLLVTFGASIEPLPGVHRGVQGAIVGLGLSLTILFNLVQYALAPMLFLAGTDFAEVGEVAAGRLSALVATAARERSTWVLACLVILIGGFLFISQPATVAAPGIHAGPLGATVGLGPVPGFELTLTAGHLVVCAQALVPLMLIAVAGWFVLRRRPAVEVPFPALVIAGLTGFGATLLLSGVTAGLGHLSDAEAVAIAVWMTSIPLAVLGVLLMRRDGRAATAGLFITAAAISFICYWNPGFLVGNPRWLVGAQLDGLSSALGLLAVILALALILTRRLRPRHGPLFRLVLTLLVGLFLLEILHDLVFGAVVGAAEKFSVTQAVLLLAALFWDIAMSGESITNRHGRHAPRHTRVLIYMGYSMLVASWILFFSSFRGEEAGAAGLLFGSSEELPSLGIELLGVPLLLTFFTVNLGAWIRGRGGSERGVIDRQVLAD